jgi:hypothetical protein
VGQEWWNGEVRASGPELQSVLAFQMKRRALSVGLILVASFASIYGLVRNSAVDENHHLIETKLNARGDVKIEAMLSFEGDLKLPVALTVRDCVGRIFTAVIESGYVPINFNGHAIILGQTNCNSAKWELAKFSPLYMENVLTMRDKSKVVPGWNLQTLNGQPVLSYCEPEPSSCRIFQFESSTGGALLGAEMIFSEKKEFLQSTDLGALVTTPNNYRGHYQFGQPVEVGQRQLFAAVGRVIVFDDGSCELLGSDRHDFEVEVLESCKR